MGNHRQTDRHREAFRVWWAADRDVQAVCRQFAVHRNSVLKWREWFGWDERADGLDADFQARENRKAVARRLKMQEDHRRAGEALRKRGVQYHVMHEITTARDATQAIKVGVDIERTAEGLPTDILELWNADTDTLRARAAQIIAEASEGAGDDTGDPGGPRGDDPGDAGCIPPGD